MTALSIIRHDRKGCLCGKYMVELKMNTPVFTKYDGYLSDWSNARMAFGDLPQEGTLVDSTISSLFIAAESGERAATDALFTALYSELHRMAKRELARRGAPPSLS